MRSREDEECGVEAGRLLPLDRVGDHRGDEEEWFQRLSHERTLASRSREIKGLPVRLTYCTVRVPVRARPSCGTR